MEKLFRRLARISFMLIWIPMIILTLIVISMVLWFGPSEFEKVVAEMSMPVTTAVFGIWIILTLFFAITTPLLAFAPNLIASRKSKKILQTGMDADAVIVSSEDTGTRINFNPVLSFSLKVMPPAGETFFAEVSQTVSVAHISYFQPGCTLSVKYEPTTKDVAIVGPNG